MTARLVAPYPGLPRLWFLHIEGDVEAAMAESGTPIRYGYVDRDYPLEAYQTLFAAAPGSAEMPSAARPFTETVLEKSALPRSADRASDAAHGRLEPGGRG